MVATSKRGATLTLPSDREILIVRELRAPRRLVFEAWTNREQLAQWYGCTAMTMASCEIDLREGGAWRWVLHMPDGSEHAFSGEYRVVARPERLVYTERYEAVPGSEHLVTIDFDERDGVTTLAMRMLYPSIVERDGHLASGMDRGLEDTMARLEDLVVAKAAA